MDLLEDCRHVLFFLGTKFWSFAGAWSSTWEAGTGGLTQPTPPPGSTLPVRTRVMIHGCSSWRKTSSLNCTSCSSPFSFARTQCTQNEQQQSSSMTHQKQSIEAEFLPIQYEESEIPHLAQSVSSGRLAKEVMDTNNDGAWQKRPPMCWWNPRPAVAFKHKGRVFEAHTSSPARRVKRRPTVLAFS